MASMLLFEAIELRARSVLRTLANRYQVLSENFYVSDDIVILLARTRSKTRFHFVAISKGLGRFSETSPIQTGRRRNRDNVSTLEAGEIPFPSTGPVIDSKCDHRSGALWATYQDNICPGSVQIGTVRDSGIETGQGVESKVRTATEIENGNGSKPSVIQESASRASTEQKSSTALEPESKAGTRSGSTAKPFRKKDEGTRINND
ncbi:hypothetical protein EVAR_50670_1 [Eumeta japonica]|uniref:Uncharacterized protein n=1 Tax=Eumeta variegata TaxID=151549 RepID=A0A4C1XM46_EUMVA|nr:hypothetical protein EVAR_50670_1 [Eumeta japonica]